MYFHRELGHVLVPFSFKYPPLNVATIVLDGCVLLTLVDQFLAHDNDVTGNKASLTIIMQLCCFLSHM